ncbi:MAG: hypothetical protein A3K09_02540 [Nitrospinae bacterium RIFCSPLOWO2_12_FULL_47_7]|nr:MAG: hypothetical protein A3K09_02540 [Nitrospinae bacterium RIFCSPLOWO2_12_FULL_47_7]
MSEPLLSERTDAKLEGRILKFSGEAMLTPGENMIEVRAIDVNGNMSRTIIRLNRSTTSAQTKSDRKSADSVRLPNIWAVIVGISRYNSPRLQLEYADKDAQSFYGFLKDSIGGAVADERIDLLTNRNATRAEIIRSINEKLRMAFEDDEVILFLACHGIPDEVSDELYFLGYDSDPDNIAGTGISQLDIQKAIASARAKKILLIVDACHSGAFGLAANMTQRGVTASLTNRLLQNLSDARPGVAIFTASSASEFSVEGKLWGGHGVFTNFLVNGLLGPADSDEDGVITIREAYEYVYRHVADATKGKQHPDLQGKFDNNLPVSVIR